jgi:hypothetical protein
MTTEQNHETLDIIGSGKCKQVLDEIVRIRGDSRAKDAGSTVYLNGHRLDEWEVLNPLHLLQE